MGKGRTRQNDLTRASPPPTNESVADFLNEDGEILKHGADLPHWQQGEVMQFVTFRLEDSVPASKIRGWKEQEAAWLAENRRGDATEAASKSRRRLARRWEKYLDAGRGTALLGNPEIRKEVESVMMRDHGSRVVHHAWVIMPNHVHVLFTPRHPLEELLRIWKGVSARKIGRGSIWQGNYRDTLIRDAEHFASVVRYIRRNPRKLKEGTFTLWEGERALGIK